MTKRTKILTLAGALAVIGTGTAIAADYTFIVPVEVKGLSTEFTSLEVSCSVYTARRFVMATKAERRALEKGGYEDKGIRIVVSVDDKRITSTWRPGKYSCGIIAFYTKAGVKHQLHSAAAGSAAPSDADLRYEPNIASAAKAQRLLWVETNLP